MSRSISKPQVDITTVIFPDLYIQNKNNEGVNEGVNEVSQILNFIEANKGIKVPEISNLIGKGISTTERYLKSLREKALIEFIGAPKTGGYYLKVVKNENNKN